MTLPLVTEIAGAPEPARLFRTLPGGPWTVWLDTALTGEAWGRYSFIAVDPFRVLRGRSGRSEWIEPSGVVPAAGDALTELAGALRRHGFQAREGLPPFAGGAAGVFGYELSAELEAIPQAAHRDFRTPDVEVGLYDLVVGWDRRLQRCWIVSTGSCFDGPATAERAARRLKQAEAWLRGGPAPAEHRLPGGSGLALQATSRPPTYPLAAASGLRSTFTAQGYREAVGRAIEWIRAGDIYQVNLSQRFELLSNEEPQKLYLSLREASPAPFGAYFAGGSFTLLSTSPERFLHVTPAGRIQARPIKGTRPRSEDPVEDSRLAAELQASVKDRAENLMIVDLLRNDLSRVCRPDSVRAVDLFRIESYSTVHHLVSTIDGRLREDRERCDLLRATFPCGSVTGAPKIRAMEIIAELEPVARGPYCGALGYLGFGGDMDTSVSIRVAIVSEGRIAFHAGGGIVADSDPGAEYEETLDKAKALATVLPGTGR